MNVEQLQLFRRDGYLVVHDFLNPEDLALMRAETQGLHEALANRVPQGVEVSWEPGVSPPRIQQIMHAERMSPGLDRVLSSERMLAFVESELGPDVSLFHAKLIMKASGSGGDIPWHQDFSYWDRESPSPMHLNCMLYIDDADEQNGCLQVIPGSHRTGVRPHAEGTGHAAFTLSLEADTSRAVSLPGRAGTAIFFGPLIAHGSGVNRSQRDRRSATVVFMMGAAHGRRVLARDPAPQNLSAFFPEATVPRISGSGPHGGGCASTYRKLELWNLASAKVHSDTAPWLELTTRSAPEDSFEWMAAHKPRNARYFRFEVFPASNSNRDDVHVLAGEFENSFGHPSFARVDQGLGLVLVDCWVYWTARSTFTRLLPHLRVGTVLVIDRFCGYAEWERESARAFYEAAQDARLSLQYLCRADTQVAIQVVGIGDGPRVCSAKVDWPKPDHL